MNKLQEQFYWAIQLADIGAMKRHIAAGADINYRPDEDESEPGVDDAPYSICETPLMMALLHRNAKMFKWLLAQPDIDVNGIKKDNGINALMLAAQAEMDNFQEIATLLIEAGTNLDHRDKEGWNIPMFVKDMAWCKKENASFLENAYLRKITDKAVAPISAPVRLYKMQVRP